MSKIAQAVREFLKDMDWDWQEPDERTFRLVVNGHRGKWPCMIRWTKDESLVGCHSHVPVYVPSNRLAAAAEYITRVNFHLMQGNFEMDHENGEVYFRTSAIIEGFEPNVEFIKSLAFSNFSGMDRYLQGLMAVAFGKVRPEAAVNEAEKPEEKAPEAKDGGEPKTISPRPKPIRRKNAQSTGNQRPVEPARDQGAAKETQVVSPHERSRRVAQIAGFLKVMNKRVHEEAQCDCFLTITPQEGLVPMDAQRPADFSRAIEFCFGREWFAIDLPNTSILPPEAQRVLKERRGFYREAERPDAGVTTNVSELVEFDPIGKKFIYGDEREAAEDAAYVLFDVWGLPPGAVLTVSASAFGDGPSWEKDQVMQ